MTSVFSPREVVSFMGQQSFCDSHCEHKVDYLYLWVSLVFHKYHLPAFLNLPLISFLTLSRQLHSFFLHHFDTMHKLLWMPFYETRLQSIYSYINLQDTKSLENKICSSRAFGQNSISKKNRYCSHENTLVSSINLIASLITLLILRVTTIFIPIY